MNSMSEEKLEASERFEPSEELRRVVEFLRSWQKLETAMLRTESAGLLNVLCSALLSGEHRADPNWVRTAHSAPIVYKATLPPVSAILRTRIAEVEARLSSLYVQRRGTRDDQGTYWCVCCGRNTVNPEQGEDTCRPCASRI